MGLGAKSPAAPFLSWQPAQQLRFWLFYTLDFHEGLILCEGLSCSNVVLPILSSSLTFQVEVSSVAQRGLC